MITNIFRRYFIRLCRRSFDVGAVLIFAYSLWFFIASGPSHDIVKRDLRSVNKTPWQHVLGDGAPGQPIDNPDLLLNSDNSDESNTMDIPDTNRRVQPSAPPSLLLDVNFDEEEPQDNVDIAGNPILTGDLSDDQKLLNYISTNLQITLEVSQMDGSNQMVVTMLNSGSSNIEAKNWHIVLCHLQNTIKRKKHNQLADGKLELHQVEGSIFTLTPTDKFKMLYIGERLQLSFGVVQTGSDFFPNWYVTAPGLAPRIIVSTAQDKLRLDYSKVIDKGLTPSKRFQQNSISEVQVLRSDFVHVIPTPANVTYKHGKQKTYTIGQWSEWAIMHTSDVNFEAQYLSKKMGGLPFTFNQEKKFIQMTTGKVKLPYKVSDDVKQEAYRIFYRPDQQSITIVGVTPVGVFYGVQTLLSLISQNGLLITDLPEFYIVDFPRVGYRGLMVDVARSFVRKREIMRTLDVMAMYKLNRLHLHLTDDQGWRLEIPGLEELTTVGSKRVDDMAEKTGLHPYLGAGPHGNTQASGYYTVQDYKDILHYANSRHIKVIPEVDMPGHSHAAIISMLARTRTLQGEGQSEVRAMQYALKDPEDTSVYMAVNDYMETTVNPCMESTFTFLEHVVAAVKELHKEIQPLESFHMGGDEVPKLALTRSLICAEFRKHHTNMTTTSDLKKYFMARASRILKNMSLSMQIWEDGIYQSDVDKTFGMSEASKENIIVQVWKKGKNERISDLVHQGYKIILSEGSQLYFDHKNEAHFEERGFHWAAPYISTYTTFTYAGIGLLKGRKSRSLKNLIGIEGALWGETVQTKQHLHTMLYPRLLALAERAWHPADWESDAHTQNSQNLDWNYFSNCLTQKELYRLDKMGLHYHIPPPGVKLIGNKAYVNTALPGLEVDISTDQGQTWKTFNNGTNVTAGRLFFATRSADKERLSRPVRIMHEAKPPSKEP